MDMVSKRASKLIFQKKVGGKMELMHPLCIHMISFCWCWNHHKMLAVKSLMSGKSKDLSLLIMLLLKSLLLLTQKHIKVRVFKCKTCPWLEEWALIINSLKVNLLTISQTDRPELSTLMDITLETWNPIWKMEKVYYPQRSELMSEIG